VSRWIARIVSLVLACAFAGVPACRRAADGAATGTGNGLLYVWAGDADEQDPDFLAVVNADPESPEYGRVIATVPVEGNGNVPHHTEYGLTGTTLFANGWQTGRTFVFDLTDPRAPRVAGSFGERGGYAYPHSYARLPNGNVLATFQSSGGAYGPTGGLVELDGQGNVVRSASGVAPDVPANENWIYSLLVLPDVDRVVTTNTRMGFPAEWRSAVQAMTDPTHHHVNQDVQSTHVQVWRLSDLALLATLRLPPQEGGHNAWTAEPRRLANGEVYVNTFSCGLYRIAGVATDRPTVLPVTFSRFAGFGFCSVPVTVGNFWIHPSSTERAIVAYDLSDPAAPREASRLALDSAYANPHWIALDAVGHRVVVTADDQPWVLIVDVDPSTGALSVDERFREPGAARAGITFDRPEWPHGAGGRAQPHGAVFGPGAR
jgi:hypothetical protein